MSNEELVEKFKAAYAEFGPKIEAEMKAAGEAIARAEALSEKAGIPFEASVSPLSQSYRPDSFDTLFGALRDADDEESLETLLDEMGLYGLPEYSGWEHSAVC